MEKISKENWIVSTVEKKENGCWVECTEGECFFVESKYLNGKEIKPGDVVTIYCICLSMIIGIDLNGERLFLKTEEQLEQERLERLAIAEQREKERFEKNKAHQDEIFSMLPKLLQHKLLMYRKFDVNFRYKQEDYEGGIMLAAWAVYKFCKSKEKITEFRNLDFEEQVKNVPEIEDVDSWNSYSFALVYATMLAEDAEHMDLNNPKHEDLIASATMMLPNALAPIIGHICYPRKEYIEKYLKSLS